MAFKSDANAKDLRNADGLVSSNVISNVIDNVIDMDDFETVHDHVAKIATTVTIVTVIATA